MPPLLPSASLPQHFDAYPGRKYVLDNRLFFAYTWKKRREYSSPGILTSCECKQGRSEAMRTVRIGSGAGYGGDRIEPAVAVMEKGDIQYIIFECLAERTIALAQQRKARHPE